MFLIPDTPEPELPVWNILVVDDDDEVHAATRFALRSVEILGRRLNLLRANSAAEAREVLKGSDAIAVILLDVVMESPQAGLELVDCIRSQLLLTEPRIILRTGQPGYAPELDVFTRYDINDYRTKSELTHTRLITSLTAAIRSYDQIRTIEQSRRGLKKVVESSSDLLKRHSLQAFSEGVLTQIAAILRIPLDGLLCAQRGAIYEEQDNSKLYVLGAAGKFAPLISHALEDINDPVIIQAIESTLDKGVHQFSEHYSTLFLDTGKNQAVVFVQSSISIAPADRQLLEVFAVNMSACFGSVNLVQKLNYIAYYDALTHLPNRSRFIQNLQNLTDEQMNSYVAALIDIDHFADINDGLGHEVGDQLLQAVAERLQQQLGECELSRVGADVFGVLGTEQWVNSLNLEALFIEPFTVGEYSLPVSVTIGLCRALEGGESGIMLLKRAYIALNRAKRDPVDTAQFFMPEMESNTSWRIEVIRNLRQAFKEQQLKVWYQPQIELSTGKAIGFEALLRWPTSDGKGFVSTPDVFVPLAEYSGLIIEIGAWVLEESCRFLQRLQNEGFEDVVVAVNVSMPQFRRPAFIDLVKSQLQHYQIPPENLELEITESLAMDEPKAIQSSLNALHHLGVLIAIDDFGTGYSSLGHLQQLPIDKLKIDRQFVNEIREGNGGMFAETIVALGQKLGLKIIAEGVETHEQAGFLRGLGCDIAQGFLYAKAMEQQQAITWMIGSARH